MLKKILFNLLFFLLFTPVFSKEINGTATVIDGDTLKINHEKIRLFGIDSPEIKQKCKKPYLKIVFFTFYKNYNCGVVSKLKLKQYVNKKNVKCVFNSRDRYNRLIADCYINEKNINSWMVKNGHAVAYKRYSKKYIFDEEYAQKNKLGIWEGSFVEPEIWRKNR